jgi:hypothetical protein
MMDLCKCKNVTSITLTGLPMSDGDYNIESLGNLPLLTSIILYGYFETDWHGDLVRFADNQISAGRDLTSTSVIVFRGVHGGYMVNYTLNGEFTMLMKFYVHFVFSSTGYSIYNLDSDVALEDYSEQTAIYTRTIDNN